MANANNFTTVIINIIKMCTYTRFILITESLLFSDDSDNLKCYILLFFLFTLQLLFMS